MLKQWIGVSASACSVLVSTTAWAIAPVPNAANICGRFTAGKYGISPDQVAVQAYRIAPRGQYLTWSISQYGSSGYCFISRSGNTTDWKVERGPRPENIADAGNAIARAEKACLAKAEQEGYSIYKRDPAKPAGSAYLINMEGTYTNQKRYELSCRYVVIAADAAITRGAEVASQGHYPDGYSNTKFMGIPFYEVGLRVKNTGYEDVSPTRRNFLVKTDASSIDFRWYADCTTKDQVYDGQKYLGYDPDARSLMAYACSLPQRPQPR